MSRIFTQPASWTAKETARRCPARYYFRYFDQSREAKAFCGIHSIREIAGQLVHQKLAAIITDIKAGGRVSDHPHAPKEGQMQFQAALIAGAKYKHASCNDNSHKIAEFENGVTTKDEEDFWETHIPHCIENGMRLMHRLSISDVKSNQLLECEKTLVYSKNGRDYRGVIDVLITKTHSVTLVDWKCHSIGTTDFKQLRMYQQWLHQHEGIPISRLYGFAADLMSEEIYACDYRPYLEKGHIYNGSQRLYSVQRVGSTDSYPAKPSLEQCGRCAYTRVCRSSAILHPASMVENFSEASK